MTQFSVSIDIVKSLYMIIYFLSREQKPEKSKKSKFSSISFSKVLIVFHYIFVIICLTYFSCKNCQPDKSTPDIKGNGFPLSVCAI